MLDSFARQRGCNDLRFEGFGVRAMIVLVMSEYEL